MQCKCKYNISIVNRVSVCPVNKIAFEGKKNYLLGLRGLKQVFVSVLV